MVKCLLEKREAWLGRSIFAVACVMLIIAFAFNVWLAAYVSFVAVALLVLALVALIPPIKHRISQLPLFKQCWLRRGSVLLVLLVANTVLQSSNHAPVVTRDNTAFVGATILSGHESSEAIEQGVVLVNAQGVITAVGSKAEITIPQGFEVVDLSGMFLLPGLINAHDHLMMFGDRDPFEPADFSGYAVDTPEGAGEWLISSYPVKRFILSMMERNARKALAGGVTTVRELATIEFLDIDLREKIARGESIGPRVLAAGKPLCITGGHGHQAGRIISGPVDARNAVREAIAKHVDVIKITSTGGVSDSRRVGEAGELQMTPEEIRAIVDEAHRKNILVAAHVESRQGVLEALRAGVDNIEHGASLDEESIALFKNNPLSLRGYSTLHPTLSVLAGGVKPLDANQDNARLAVINANAEIIRDELISGYQAAVANGVHVGVGTDSGVVTHDSVWAELKLFIEYGGVSNEQAIYMGTLATARSIGVDSITGSVEVGKMADLMIVAEDPRNDIAALSEPLMVVARGVQYDPSTL